jgi:hypothetical protein
MRLATSLRLSVLLASPRPILHPPPRAVSEVTALTARDAHSFAPVPRSMFSSSIGSGKMIVEFFSEAISVSV